METEVPSELKLTARFYDILYGGSLSNFDELCMIIDTEDKLYEFTLFVNNNTHRFRPKTVPLLIAIIQHYNDKIIQNDILKPFMFSPMINKDKYIVNKVPKTIPLIFENDSIKAYDDYVNKMIKHDREHGRNYTSYMLLYTDHKYYSTQSLLDYAMYHDLHNIVKYILVSYSDDDFVKYNPITKDTIFAIIIGNSVNAPEYMRYVQQLKPELFDDLHDIEDYFIASIIVHNNDIARWFELSFLNISCIEESSKERFDTFIIKYRNISYKPCLFNSEKLHRMFDDLTLCRYCTKDNHEELQRVIGMYATQRPFVGREIYDMTKVVCYALQKIANDENYNDILQRFLNISSERYSLEKTYNRLTIPILNIVYNKINDYIVIDHKLEYIPEFIIYICMKTDKRKQMMKYLEDTKLVFKYMSVDNHGRNHLLRNILQSDISLI